MAKKYLKGIFTEKDLVKIFAEYDAIFADMPIKKFMTKNIITITLTDSIIKALSIMTSNSILYLPVYNKAKNILYGIISYNDFALKIME